MEMYSIFNNWCQVKLKSNMACQWKRDEYQEGEFLGSQTQNKYIQGHNNFDLSTDRKILA